MKKAFLFGLLILVLTACTSTQKGDSQDMTSRYNMDADENWWIVEYEDEQSD